MLSPPRILPRKNSHKSTERLRDRLLNHLRFECLEDRRLLATSVWDGGAGTANWSDAANWFDQANTVNDVAPA